MDDDNVTAALVRGATEEIRRDRLYRVTMMVVATVVALVLGLLGARLLVRQQDALEDRDRQVDEQIEAAHELAMGAQRIAESQATRLRDAATDRRLLLAQITTLITQLDREGVAPIVILPDDIFNDVPGPVEPPAPEATPPVPPPAPAPPPPAPVAPPPEPSPQPDPSPAPAMWHPDLLPGPPQPAPTPEPTEVVSAVDLTPPEVEYRFPEPPPLRPRPPPMWDQWAERDR
jgi:hypothetical protein